MTQGTKTCTAEILSIQYVYHLNFFFLCNEKTIICKSVFIYRILDTDNVKEMDGKRMYNPGVCQRGGKKIRKYSKFSTLKFKENQLKLMQAGELNYPLN